MAEKCFVPLYTEIAVNLFVKNPSDAAGVHVPCLQSI